MNFWVIGSIAAAVIIILWVILTFNKLVSLRNRVEDQWSQIDVQLKRRFDLIPNIVNTVKGYATHEESTLEAVMAARNSFAEAATPEAEMEANRQVSGALVHLFAVSEAYPELKADAAFMDLQNQLKETENKIAFARQFYNDIVLKYKNAREMFPSNIVAGIFGFKPRSFFEADSAEKENVRVSL